MIIPESCKTVRNRLAIVPYLLAYFSILRNSFFDDVRTRKHSTHMTRAPSSKERPGAREHQFENACNLDARFKQINERRFLSEDKIFRNMYIKTSLLM